MIWLLFSAILFGFVHPGSKFILGHGGLNLFGFCFLYVAIRWLTQIVVVVFNRPDLGVTKSNLGRLLLLGLVGAALQISEFKGVADGLQVPVVTFLVYCQPIWVAIIGWSFFGRKSDWKDTFKVIVGISGIMFIILASSDLNISALSLSLLAPISASVFIALWVLISDEIKRSGITPLGMSLFYDTFAIVGLVFAWVAFGKSTDLNSTLVWVKVPDHFFVMTAYSIFIGLLPNLLFYRGVGKVSSLQAGLILLLEPVISATVSKVMWSDHLSAVFLLGASLVIVAASPVDQIATEFRRALTLRPGRARVIFIVIAIAFALSIIGTQVGARTLELMEIVPTGTNDYIVSEEFKEIGPAFDMAIKDSQEFFAKSCKFETKKTLRRGSEEDLFRSVSDMGKLPSLSDAVLIGFSRSNFARLAAKAAQGSKIIAYSSGAATSNLREINPNFYSVASPWTSQWETHRWRRHARHDSHCTSRFSRS